MESNTLVCVPGLGLDSRAWAPVLDSLPGWHTSVVELPGLGTRPGHGDDVSPPALGELLVRRHLSSGTPVVLAGHSASCQVVVEAALAAPEAVTALVLVGPTTDSRARSWPALAGRWLRTAVHEPPQQVPTLARSYARVGLIHMLNTMNAARGHDIRHALARLSCPVLVVRGPQDRICPGDWAVELAATAAVTSRAITLAAGAHMVPLTHGSSVADQVRGLTTTQ